MKRRFYNIELFKKEEIKALREYLKQNGHYYEASACGSGTHFEIRLSRAELAAIGEFVKTL